MILGDPIPDPNTVTTNTANTNPTHDPLCPSHEWPHYPVDCRCDLITIARANQNERIAQAIVANCPYGDHYDVGCPCIIFARIARNGGKVEVHIPKGSLNLPTPPWYGVNNA